MKITNKILGKKVFVGIDVHKRMYAVCCISEGQIVHRCTTKADPTEFAHSLRHWFPEQEIFSVYEAGFSGFVLHRKLSAKGINSIIVNPASVERAPNDKVKTDALDSKKLATQLAMGNLSGIYVPSEAEELARQFNRTRQQLVEDRVAVGNRIKSKLTLFGFYPHETSAKMSNLFLKKIEKMELPSTLRIVVGILIAEWRYLQKQILLLQRHMRIENTKQEKLNEVICSIPGVGLISANTLLSELGDMSRFSTEGKLFSFLGLTPTEYSSGDNIRRGHITRKGAPRLRRILIEIAWRTIGRDQALHEVYGRIAQRRGSKIAIVAIARKLSGRMRSCLRSGTKYRIAALVA
jgi:transposase